MTSAQLKNNVDTMLDEVTGASTFWTSTEVYQALADGQNEIIKWLVSVYRITKKLPYELESVLNDDTGTSALDPTAITIPTGFVELISATYDHDNSGGEKPCFIINMPDLEFDEDNTFLVADGANPKIYIKSISDTLKFVFLPTATTGAPYTINYIKTPADIASGQEPILPVSTHQAIILFAVARMLFKDDNPKAQGIFSQYLQTLQTLMR